MNRVDSLISEISVDFVHAVQATDHQPLQIKFRSDPQIKIHVECVVMRHKGSRPSPLLKWDASSAFPLPREFRSSKNRRISRIICARITNTSRVRSVTISLDNGAGIAARHPPARAISPAAAAATSSEISSSCTFTVSSFVFVEKFSYNSDNVAQIEQPEKFERSFANTSSRT